MFQSSSQAVNPPQSVKPDRLSEVIELVGRIAEQQRSVLDALRTPSPSQAAAPSASLTAEEIRAVVAEQFSRQQATAIRTAARQSYLRQHCSDLPEAYRRLLPETDNTADLAQAEQDVRKQYRDDLKSARRQTGEGDGAITGQPHGGESPAAAVDFSKLSPLGQIELGLRGAAVPAPRKSAAPAQPEPDPHEELFVGAD